MINMLGSRYRLADCIVILLCRFCSCSLVDSVHGWDGFFRQSAFVQIDFLAISLSCHHCGSNPFGPESIQRYLSPSVDANTITTLRDLTLPQAGPSHALCAVPPRPLPLRTISDSSPVPQPPRATDRQLRPRRWVAAAVSVTASPVQPLVDDCGVTTTGGYFAGWERDGRR